MFISFLTTYMLNIRRMPEQEFPPCACTDGLAVRCELCIQITEQGRCDQSQQNHVSHGRSRYILIQPSNLEDRDCAINLVYYIYHPRTCATEYTLRINKDPSFLGNIIYGLCKLLDI